MDSPIKKNSNPKSGKELIVEKKKTELYTIQLGIWEVILPVSTKWSSSKLIYPSVGMLKSMLSTFELLSRLFQDIYSLAPQNFVLHILQRIVVNFRDIIITYIDGHIWELVCTLDFS